MHLHTHGMLIAGVGTVFRDKSRLSSVKRPWPDVENPAQSTNEALKHTKYSYSHSVCLSPFSIMALAEFIPSGICKAACYYFYY